MAGFDLNAFKAGEKAIGDNVSLPYVHFPKDSPEGKMILQIRKHYTINGAMLMGLLETYVFPKCQGPKA